LTVIINRTLAGARAESYPRTYSGFGEFSINGITYPGIDAGRMAVMPASDYTSRLVAFKLYVEGLELGLNINSDTTPGGEAYRENLTACPTG
jgi:hypothetical protein